MQVPVNPGQRTRAMDFSWVVLVAAAVGLPAGYGLMNAGIAATAYLRLRWTWNVALGILIVGAVGIGASLRAAYVYGIDRTSLESLLFATLLCSLFFGAEVSLLHLLYRVWSSRKL